jgi:hypothetical protein
LVKLDLATPVRDGFIDSLDTRETPFRGIDRQNPAGSFNG